jgi:hypothetical protein
MWRDYSHCLILVSVDLKCAGYAGIKDSLLSSKGGPPGSAEAGVYYAFELIHAEKAISESLESNFGSQISASSLSI